MPSWFAQFAMNRPDKDGLIHLGDEDVLKFLLGLRDAKVPSWQRLQAARSLEWFQTLVLRSNTVDFLSYKIKLHELAEKERSAPEVWRLRLRRFFAWR